MRITGLLLLCFLGSGLLWGQSYNYVLSWENAADHIYTVDLNIDPESGSNTHLFSKNPGALWVLDPKWHGTCPSLPPDDAKACSR